MFPKTLNRLRVETVLDLDPPFCSIQLLCLRTMRTPRESNLSFCGPFWKQCWRYRNQFTLFRHLSSHSSFKGWGTASVAIAFLENEVMNSSTVFQSSFKTSMSPSWRPLLVGLSDGVRRYSQRSVLLNKYFNVTLSIDTASLKMFILTPVFTSPFFF